MDFFKGSQTAANLEPAQGSATPAPGAPGAAEAGLIFPRPNRSKWGEILVWAGCASLVFCGGVTVVFAFIPWKQLSHFFLGIYFVLFGLCVFFAERRFAFAERGFGILCTKFGLSFFFIFAGTLGISFGIARTVGVLVPFVCGICWCLVGALTLTDSAIRDKKRNAASSVEVEGV